MKLRRFWCWLLTGHVWDKTDSKEMMSREMNHCNICKTYLPGPD